MFNSNITAQQLIDELKSEVDIALEIPDSTYITFLNSLQQMLYRNYIQEKNEYVVMSFDSSNEIDLSRHDNSYYYEAPLEFEDITAVFINNNLQLIKVNPENGPIFPNSYWKSGVNLKYNCKNTVKSMRIVYIVKPELCEITYNGEIRGNVMVPLEFIELVKSKLRSEVYMLANEYTAAANQISRYNALLEDFVQWLERNRPQFG